MMDYKEYLNKLKTPKAKHRIAKEIYKFVLVALISFIIGVFIAIDRYLDPCRDWAELFGIPFIIILWGLGIFYFIRLLIMLGKYSSKGYKWVMKWKEENPA